LRPDFKTIADFRKDNCNAFKAVFREFVLLCRKLDLFGRELVAVDGTRLKAVNSTDRNFTREKLKRLIHRRMSGSLTIWPASIRPMARRVRRPARIPSGGDVRVTSQIIVTSRPDGLDARDLLGVRNAIRQYPSICVREQLCRIFAVQAIWCAFALG
jgi:hypothetical protein